MEMFGDLLDPIIESVAFQTASLALGLIAFVSAVALVFWLFRDARRRGSFSIFWGLIGTAALIAGVVVGFGQTDWGFITVGAASLTMVLVVLLAYTLLRPAEFAADAQERELSQRLLEAELETHACPSCGAGIEVDFLICPSCHVTLRRPCDYCARPMKTGWATCPYCLARKGQGETRASAAPSKRRPSGGGSGSSSSGGGSPTGRSGSSGSSTGRRRSAAKPAPRDEGSDDLELNFDTAKTDKPRRSSSSGRTSTGSRSSTGSSGRKANTATSTFKD